jgi:hypothetical protein
MNHSFFTSFTSSLFNRRLSFTSKRRLADECRYTTLPRRSLLPQRGTFREFLVPPSPQSV